MIVCSQSSIFEFLCLRSIDHAQGNTRLHAHATHALDHFLDVLKIRLAASHVSPGSAHAES